MPKKKQKWIECPKCGGRGKIKLAPKLKPNRDGVMVLVQEFKDCTPGWYVDAED